MLLCSVHVYITINPCQTFTGFSISLHILSILLTAAQTFCMHGIDSGYVHIQVYNKVAVMAPLHRGGKLEPVSLCAYTEQKPGRRARPRFCNVQIRCAIFLHGLHG